MTLGVPDSDPNGLPGRRFGGGPPERARGILLGIIVIAIVLLMALASSPR